MAYGGSWPGAKRQRTKERQYKEVPSLNPDDAGFIPEVALPDFAAAAQQNAARAAHQGYAQAQQHAQQQQQDQHQQLAPRRALRPSDAQTAVAAGLQAPPPVPAALRGPEGVLADDSDDDWAADDPSAVASAAQAAGRTAARQPTAAGPTVGPAASPAAAAAASAAASAPAGVDAMSDTLAALWLLAMQFPAAARAIGLPPIMLKAQVYSIVADRTAVDREIEDLRREGVVRIFKLASGAADEYAFMFAKDYTAVVQRQRVALAAKQVPAAHLAAFDWFLHSVVPACPEVYITHRQLLSLLAQPPPDTAAAAAAAPLPVAERQSPAHSVAAVQHSNRDVRPQPQPLRPPVQRRGAAAAAGAGSAAAGAAAGRKASAGAAGSPSAVPECATGVAAIVGGATASGTTTNGSTVPAIQIGTGAARSSAPGRPVRSRGTSSRTNGSVAAAAEQPHKVTDAHVSLLLNAGLLARHASDRGLYLFGVPDTGPLVKSMAKGRAEVLGLVSRRKYGELMERDLAGRKLQRSLLDIRFHVRDLIGHGELQRVHTTVGPLLRAVKHG